MTLWEAVLFGLALILWDLSSMDRTEISDQISRILRSRCNNPNLDDEVHLGHAGGGNVECVADDAEYDPAIVVVGRADYLAGSDHHKNEIAGEIGQGGSSIHSNRPCNLDDPRNYVLELGGSQHR